jgi:hypothetical protein
MGRPEIIVVNQRTSKFDINIGRPSIWGNKFSHLEDSLAEFKVATREESIEKHREWVQLPEQKWLIDRLFELVKREKRVRLGCWCKPLACHGDILVELLYERYF